MKSLQRKVYGKETVMGFGWKNEGLPLYVKIGVSKLRILVVNFVNFGNDGKR